MGRGRQSKNKKKAKHPNTKIGHTGTTSSTTSSAAEHAKNSGGGSAPPVSEPHQPKVPNLGPLFRSYMAKARTADADDWDFFDVVKHIKNPLYEKEVPPSLPEKPFVPDNAAFGWLYTLPNFGLGTKSTDSKFKILTSWAYQKYGIEHTETTRQVNYMLRTRKGCELEWDTLNLPPKPYAAHMFKVRTLHMYQKPEVGVDADCGMDAKYREAWKICEKDGVCQACLENCIERFAKVGTGVSYDVGEFEIRRNEDDGDFDVIIGVAETVVRKQSGAVPKREVTQITLTFSVPDPKKEEVLSPEIKEVLYELIVLSTGLTGIEEQESSESDDDDEADEEENLSESDDTVKAEDDKSNSFVCNGSGCSEPFCPMCRIFGTGSVLNKLRGIKNWNPMDCNAAERQFVLRLAKKYHIDIEESKILQLTVTSFKYSGDDATAIGENVPKFARIKNAKRRILGRKDFPKFEFSDEEFELFTRPYAHLDLLDKNKEDGIFLLALADTIGLGKVKPEMIAVYEKNFGCDPRLEQFRSEVLKTHKNKIKLVKKTIKVPEGTCGPNRVPGLPTQN